MAMLLRASILVALALWLSARVSAQTGYEERMNRLERRLDEMEKKYQAELKARDEEIARLRAIVEKQEAQRRSQSATQSAPLIRWNPEERPTAQNRQPTTAPIDEIAAAKQAVLKDIPAREGPTTTVRLPASFNPNLAVIGDFRGNVSTRNENPARNRFDLGAVELDLRAAVDPRADAVVILPVVREVEDPLFFNPQDAEGDVETAIELEEAYLFLHDFGAPNLTARLGRYKLRFGRWNPLHRHDWPTVDNAFAVQSFLGPESLGDSGLSLSYVLPPALVGNQYVELIAEVIAGEGSEGAPLLNNDAFVDGPALNTHALWNRDLGRDWNIELGGSWLTGKHDSSGDHDVNLFGADVTLMRTDQTGRFNNHLFQSELFYAITDTSRAATPRSTSSSRISISTC
jgi:hypothetical protein